MPQPKSETTLADISAALSVLNYRLTARAVKAWQGENAGSAHVYEGFQHLLDPAVIRDLRRNSNTNGGEKRIFHTLLGHYLQYRILPYENEFFSWMKGAAADVNGQKIYLKDIIAWCQKRSTFSERRTIEKESSKLCKFLRPFALSYWECLLELLDQEFGYPDYVSYCEDKKGYDYAGYARDLEAMLDRTEALYREAMDGWGRKSCGVPLSELNRFDAIYLLGMGDLDPCFPEGVPLRDHLRFFHCWGIHPEQVPGLVLDIDHSQHKTSQALTFALRIPEEIRLVMNPQGGWTDLETLFHEMGHALSGAFTSPDLQPYQKDFYPSNALSETYAFLIQNITFSSPFLQTRLGLSQARIEALTYYKTLRDLAVFRRYAAKFLAEYFMFKEKDAAAGEHYARLLYRHTGFSYQAETHLFDLAPEFYALDYVVSWMAEATTERWLRERLGEAWMFTPEAGEILKGWWRWGNRYEIDEFFSRKGLGAITSTDLENRWQRVLAGTNGPELC